LEVSATTHENEIEQSPNSDDALNHDRLLAAVSPS
jgi:hypothetical protein